MSPIAWWLLPWRILPEPRIVSAIMVSVYATFLIMGGAWYLDPQDAVTAHRLGLASGHIMAALWMAGGFCGLLSLRPGFWWLERAGLLFAAGGLIGRALIVTDLADGGELVVRGGIILIAVAGLAIRMVRIMGLAVDPTKGSSA